MKHHDCSSLEVGRHCCEIRQQQRGLIGRLPGRTVAKQHHRRTRRLSQGQHRSEIGVGRNQDPALVDGGLEHLVISCGMQGERPNVDGIVARSSQQVGATSSCGQERKLTWANGLRGETQGVATGMRRPRMHGTPPIWAGFTVMRSKSIGGTAPAEGHATSIRRPLAADGG